VKAENIVKITDSFVTFTYLKNALCMEQRKRGNAQKIRNLNEIKTIKKSSLPPM
jgi:hypothetical protein